MKDIDTLTPDDDRAAKRSKPGRLAQTAYRAVGCIAMALAAAGVVLPGLPTTPFLLVALWAFSRGAPEWAERLRKHPRYGPFLRNWEDRQAIPRPAKVAAVVGVTASWTLLAFTVHNPVLVAVVGVIMICVLAYVISRPSR